mmetsp:Transcript_6798/g.16408  ORF Transcript_6798/g.16408 Transcript_6798/m.16408 type:complete len:216 (+) Transcript_6798:300-947(+)
MGPAVNEISPAPVKLPRFMQSGPYRRRHSDGNSGTSPCQPGLSEASQKTLRGSPAKSKVSHGSILGEEDESTCPKDVMEIRERLRLHAEFDGIDFDDNSLENYEQAIVKGYIPLKRAVDYVADMAKLARVRALGRPIPPWALRMIEAANVIQRRWREVTKKPWRCCFLFQTGIKRTSTIFPRRTRGRSAQRKTNGNGCPVWSAWHGLLERENRDP